MGCDIHAMIEKKGKNDWWANAGDPEINRDYTIFAVLANVRNYNEIPCIADPRGVPEDCCSEFNAWVESWRGDGHSHSWLTLREMKEFDIHQEIYDGSLILTKTDDGKIHATCRFTTGAHLGPVGKTTIFGAFGPEPWLDLIKKMEAVGRDEDVRLVFFFDN